jgi:hypothetical protein
VQAQSASLGVIASICQVLLALWKVLGSCSVLQVEAVLQNVLLRLADGERKGRGDSYSQESCLLQFPCRVCCSGFLVLRNMGDRADHASRQSCVWQYLYRVCCSGFWYIGFKVCTSDVVLALMFRS